MILDLFNFIYLLDIGGKKKEGRKFNELIEKYI